MWQNWKVGDEVLTYRGVEFILGFFPYNYGMNCKIIVGDENKKNQMCIHDNHLIHPPHKVEKN